MPEYFINHISLEDINDDILARAETFGALSSNPIFIIDFIENLNISLIIVSYSKAKIFNLNTK